MTTALVIVDVQNDFCPGGSLATAHGDEVAKRIWQLVEGDHGYAHILATQDWHIDPGAHFSDSPDFVDSWPVHCVANSVGAELRAPLNPGLISAFFRKGEYSAAYSGFEASNGEMGLADWLNDANVQAIDVCGIATDHCVRATVIDGLRSGFHVRVLSDLCSPVDDARGRAALAEMQASGAELV
ncbi:isochorismatase family protein [Corynebacterium qintianiae]|uniref:nicotinamidase n=1 Tax=Corynebacterium qintianiae TaxID=2709392 RepID=A0A7T0PDG1_9CORY|nr:isochorismatase family protein [Corynebacterium qintianiae]QPK82903.1 isochorismatase family protein [Corynebacterium qintianiae]